MAGKLAVLKNIEGMEDYIGDISATDDPKPALCELGGGVLKFVDAAFPDVETPFLYAQLNEREPQGRGAHFDVYGDYVDNDFQWIGIYNLAGRAAVRTTVMPPELAKSYFDTFPTPDDKAFEARRHYSALALMDPKAEILEGQLNPRTGLILPQRKQGPHIVHDIIPVDSGEPGKFIKFVVPNRSKQAEERIMKGDYEAWDEFVTLRLGGEASQPTATARAAKVVVRRPARSIPRRSCNLD